MPDDLERSKWPEKSSDLEMPDLRGLKFLSVFFGLHRTLAGGGPKDPTSYALAMNFVRIVDKTVMDYGHARGHVLTYLEETASIGNMIAASGYMESCVASLLRAINFGIRLRSLANGPNVIPKGLPVLQDRVKNRVNAMRNAIEHLDSELLEGKTPPTPICLVVKRSCVELGNQQISFAELEQWIRQLHEQADKLAHYKE